MTFTVEILAAAFLMGSVPFGVWVAKMFKVNDLTQRGSGNIGATNVTRLLGFWPAGFLTLFLDVAKGAIPVVVLGSPETLARLDAPLGFQASPNLIWAAALFSVLGHCYSPWLRFKGGKGVATGLGAISVLSPWAALGGLTAFIFTFYRTRLGSLSSLAGLLSASAVHLVLFHFMSHFLFGALILFVILLRHESNIDALLTSQERSF